MLSKGEDIEIDVKMISEVVEWRMSEAKIY